MDSDGEYDEDLGEEGPAIVRGIQDDRDDARAEAWKEMGKARKETGG